MIHIDGASKAYGKQIILENIALHIEQPGMYFLLGKSGSGKTTLLNILSGYDDFDAGEIHVQGSVVSIFQNYELIDALNVYENIFLGRNVDNEDLSILDSMHITELLKQYPKGLSGGQKQRVSIARAMVAKADILCCDEPAATLDFENRQVVLEILRKYAEKHIVIVASHDVDSAVKYADGIYRIVNRQLQYVDVSHHLNRVCLSEKQPVFNRQQLNRFFRKINHKTSCLFHCVCIVLLIILQSLCIVENTLFSIPDTHLSLNANMIRVEVKNQEAVQKAQPCIKVNSIFENTNEYSVNVYPYISNPQQLKITGKLPQHTDVLVNQNVVREVLNGVWKNKEITMCLQVIPYIYRVNARVCGVVEEVDTDEMHVYYDEQGMEEYMHTVSLSDGRTLKDLFQENNTYFVKRVAYEKLRNTLDRLNENPNIDARSEFLEEKQKQKEEMQAYRYVCVSGIVVIVLLTLIFVFVFTKKEMECQMKGYVVMIANGVDEKAIRMAYLKIKESGIILFCFVDGIVLFLLGKIIHFPWIIVFGYFVGIVVLSAGVSLWMFQTSIKKHVACTLKSEV